jgi:ATP-dependent helicase/DNAse subunit B
MAVQFVIGRAGSGKTRRCLAAILAALRDEPLGPPVYLILPKQATFQAERALACAAGAFCRARVVSFEQLGREIFAWAGGNVIPEVTPLGRQMVIGHLLRQLKPRLRFFASSARQPGLAVELDAAFAEFERSGKTVAELDTIIDDLTVAGPVDVDGVSLLAKLRDLRLVYDAYTTFLGQERLDPHRRLQQVLGCLDGCPPLRGATVYVEGFTEFSDHERRLLAGLAKVAARLTITLPLDPASPLLCDPHALPDEAGLFLQPEQTYRRLWFTFAEENVTVEKPLRLTDAHRFAEPVLAMLERAMFPERVDHDPRHGAEPTLFDTGPASRQTGPRASVLAHGTPKHTPVDTVPGPDRSVDTIVGPDRSPGCHGHVLMPVEPGRAPPPPVRLTLAPHRPAEVDAAARGIRALWRQGYRLRDIAVLVRDLEPYHALIDASFREHGIAHFVDRRRTAAHHPLLQFVRSVFQIVRFEWPNEAVLGLMKSGLAGLSLAEADEVENYVDAHRIRGEAWASPEPWSFRRRITRSEDANPETPDHPENADALRRRVVDRLRPTASLLRLNESLTVREIATELFTLLDRFRVREALAAWAAAAAAAGDPEQAAEHEQVWAEFADLADQMVDLLGAERVTLADFIDVLESGLERFDLALTPPTVDQVLVGQVDRTRTPKLKAVFLLGLNEGEFPRVAREPSVLTEPERKELRRRKVELDADRRRQLQDEDFLGYVAFTRASHRVIASRTRADDAGKPVNASRFWHRLRELVPDAPVEEIPRDTRDEPRFMETPRQVLVGLMRWARESAPLAAPSVTPAPPLSPSPGTPGEGGERVLASGAEDPHPNPLPAYRARGPEGESAAPSLPLSGTPGRGREGSFTCPGDEPPLSPTLSPAYRGEGEMQASLVRCAPLREQSFWPALYQWLATYPRDDDAIGTLRTIAWRAIGYANGATLAAELAERLFKTPFESTPRQLETFATCPFKHYLKYGLGLASREAAGVTNLDLSQVYHQVLDIVVKEVLERNADWQALGKTVTPDVIRTYAQAVGQALKGELMLSTARNKYLLGRVERTLNEVVASQAEMMRRGQFRPSFTGVAFGEKGALPALRVTTPHGRHAVLHGSIDRVDVLPGGTHAAVFDYKLSAGPLSMQDVYYGMSLQLLTYLLVLQANGAELAGQPITPVAAFYLPLVRRIRDVKHPEDATSPDTPKFHLRVKPRGVFDATYLDALDQSLENGAFSDVVVAYKSKDGGLGRRNASDVADPAEFAALLSFVMRRIGQLADQIVAGRVDIAPYWINRQTPCGRCDYRSVCRFETSVNRYTILQPLRREDVLKKLVEADG